MTGTERTPDGSNAMSTLPEDESYQAAENIHAWWVKARRKVGKQRARKLRRRGEFVWWSEELRSRVWIWHGRHIS